MKPQYLILVPLLALPVGLHAEADKPVKFADLPAAAAKAIKAAAGDAKLAEIVLGDEDGTPAYETSWQATGHTHEIAVTKDGKVLSLEEIITLKEAPEPIRRAITAEAAGRKVLEVEKISEQGGIIFEATISKGKGKVQVSFDEAGKVLERVNPDAEKDSGKAAGK